MEKPQLITKSRLKSERNWTDKLIKLFLPAPDSVKPNPHWRAGPPMQLFALSQIEAVEQTEDFQQQLTASQPRRQAAEKAIATKMRQMQSWLASVQIRVPVLDRDTLIERACGHYNDMQRSREAEGGQYCELKADADSDPEFLQRISVNYLRHCLTQYERHLETMSGKVGAGTGYEDLRSKVFSEISKNYPWLDTECERQEETREVIGAFNEANQ
jgi:hypothetical protein